MFHNLGWSELIVLGVLGLLIFGPERLPKVASDAVRMLRELRNLARGAAADLKAELGPEIADLDLASLHPRRLVASVLENEDPAEPASRPVSRRQALTAAMGPGQVPPYDADAT